MAEGIPMRDGCCCRSNLADGSILVLGSVAAHSHCSIWTLWVQFSFRLSAAPVFYYSTVSVHSLHSFVVLCGCCHAQHTVRFERSIQLRCCMAPLPKLRKLQLHEGFGVRCCRIGCGYKKCVPDKATLPPLASARTL